MVGLSEIDPNSFCRPDECIVTHLHLDIDVDFVDRKLRGSVKIGIRKVTPSAQRLVSVMCTAHGPQLISTQLVICSAESSIAKYSTPNSITAQHDHMFVNANKAKQKKKEGRRLKRLSVNSSHGQLVIRSTRHTVNSSQVNSSLGQLVTRSTRHKEAVNSSQAHKQANIKALLPQQYNYP